VHHDAGDVLIVFLGIAINAVLFFEMFGFCIFFSEKQFVNLQVSETDFRNSKYPQCLHSLSVCRVSITSAILSKGIIIISPAVLNEAHTPAS
jgi:hypothetical protein